jgi:hypothetical protein
MKKLIAIPFGVAFGLLTARAVGGQTTAKYPACPLSQLSKPAYAVKTVRDEFDGTTTVEGSDIPLVPFGSIRSFGSDEVFSLKIRGYPEKSQSASYLLFFMWSGHSWVFIDKESPMLLLVDGQKISLRSDGEPTRDVMDGGVFEEHVYRLPVSVITRIAKAAVVKIRVTGDKYIPDFTLPPKGTCAVARFIIEGIEKSAVPPDPNAALFGAYDLVMYNGAYLPTHGIVSGHLELFVNDQYEFAYSDGHTTWYDERGFWRRDGTVLVLEEGTINGQRATELPDWSGSISQVGTISMKSDPFNTADHPAMLFKR